MLLIWLEHAARKYYNAWNRCIFTMKNWRYKNMRGTRNGNPYYFIQPSTCSPVQPSAATPIYLNSFQNYMWMQSQGLTADMILFSISYSHPYIWLWYYFNFVMLAANYHNWLMEEGLVRFFFFPREWYFAVGGCQEKSPAKPGEWTKLLFLQQGGTASGRNETSADSY